MNPVYEEQKQTLDFIEVAGDILRNARNELYLNMRFLDVALSSLAYLPDQQIRMTDVYKRQDHRYRRKEGLLCDQS